MTPWSLSSQNRHKMDMPAPVLPLPQLSTRIPTLQLPSNSDELVNNTATGSEIDTLPSGFDPSHLLIPNANGSSVSLHGPALSASQSHLTSSSATSLGQVSQNHDQIPPLTRKRSKLFSLRRLKSKNTGDSPSTPHTSSNPNLAIPNDNHHNHASHTPVTHDSFLAGVMASKDPAAELRKLAASRPPLSRDDNASLVTQSFQHTALSPPRLSHLEASSSDPIKNRSLNFLSRKQKNRRSLFPFLADQAAKSRTAPPSASGSPRPSTSMLAASDTSGSGPHRSKPHMLSRSQPQFAYSSQQPQPHQQPKSQSQSQSSSLSPQSQPQVQTISQSHRSAASLSSNAPRSSSAISDRSAHSFPRYPDTLDRGRKRSFAGDSASVRSEETSPTPPFITASGRNSTSTAGRSSFSNLFHFGQRVKNQERFSRHNSGSNMTPVSASNSIVSSREMVLPNRRDGEGPIQFLERLQLVAPRSHIPAMLSKTEDVFLLTVMRSFMRTYKFYNCSLDMAIRHLLRDVILPMETQQIDRVLQSFADRYHECNPGIFASTDKVHLLTFSIIMLHTDVFNKNNPSKMNKVDYIKNLRDQGVSKAILSCIYDNTVYTPFIRIEQDQESPISSQTDKRKSAKAEKAANKAKAEKAANKAKHSGFAEHESSRLWNQKDPLDPYTLLLESINLDTIRPPLKDLIAIEDPYSYLGTLASFDSSVLRNSKIGIIQIESSRSRPDAFTSASGINNPQEAKAGLVDLPINKVGFLLRKRDAKKKKKKGRSPWHEWGAILTSTGLYFYKNAGWVKEYVHQYQSWVKKHPHSAMPCTFKPPVSSTSFSPDQMIPTDHGVALRNANYKRHKNAFTFFPHDNSEEIFQAQDEADMNDWIMRLNHQAACKTAKILQRGAHISTPIATPNSLAHDISQVKQKSIVERLEEAQAKAQVIQQDIDAKLQEARRLFVLTPFQPHTRIQLEGDAIELDFHLKKCRIEKWRLQCHSDILRRELLEEQTDYGVFHNVKPLPPCIMAEGREGEGKNDTGNGTVPAGSDIGIGQKQETGSNLTPATAGPEEPGSESEVSIQSPMTSSEDVGYHTPLETPVHWVNSDRLDNKGASSKPLYGRHSIDSGTTKSSVTTKEKRHGHQLSTSSHFSHLQPPAPRPSLEDDFSTSTQSDDDEDDEGEEGEYFSDAENTATEDRDGATEVCQLDGALGHQAGIPPPTSPMKRVEKPMNAQATPNRRVSRQSFRDGLSGRALVKSIKGLHGSKSESGTKLRNDGETNGASLPSAAGGTNEKAEDNDANAMPGGNMVLPRSSGSFTIHGKKASVVTFGGEWTSTAERVLERMKAANSVPTGKSPLNQTQLASEDSEGREDQENDDTIRDLESNVSTTPTPSSPHGVGLRRQQLKNAANHRTSLASTIERHWSHEEEDTEDAEQGRRGRRSSQDQHQSELAEGKAEQLVSSEPQADEDPGKDADDDSKKETEPTNPWKRD